MFNSNGSGDNSNYTKNKNINNLITLDKLTLRHIIKKSIVKSVAVNGSKSSC